MTANSTTLDQEAQKAESPSSKTSFVHTPAGIVVIALLVIIIVAIAAWKVYTASRASYSKIDDAKPSVAIKNHTPARMPSSSSQPRWNNMHEDEVVVNVPHSDLSVMPKPRTGGRL
jgi:hypothetical protein